MPIRQVQAVEGHPVRASASSRAMAACTLASTSLEPSATDSFGQPKRALMDALPASRHPDRRIEARSRRACRGRRSRVTARRVVHRCAEDANVVERRRERDEPEAADAAVRRLDADHTAESAGWRTSRPSPSRVRSRRSLTRRPPPSRPMSRQARGPARADCASVRTRCARWTSPSRTRPCWSCRREWRPLRAACERPSLRTGSCNRRGCWTRRSWAA